MGDAGRLDAGEADASVDAGADGGTSGDDAGADAGALDAGDVDAGTEDAGVADAGPDDAGVTDAGVPAALFGGCDAWGWCLEATAGTYQLTDVHGVSATDVWAVGFIGTALRWNGLNWVTQPSPTSDNFNAVWAVSASDVYAGTQSHSLSNGSSVYRFDGSQWTKVLSDPDAYAIFDLWASGPSDVFALASKYTTVASWVNHWDGQTWTKHNLPADNASAAHLAGTGPTDVWAGGAALSHWDGTAWTSFGPAGGEVQGLWATSPTFAVASVRTLSGTRMLIWDGTAWNESTSAITASDGGVYGPTYGPNLWAAGPSAVIGISHNSSEAVRFDGSSWIVEDTGLPAPLCNRLLWGASATDVWSWDCWNSMVRWDGTKWNQTGTGLRDIHAIGGPSATELWAVGAEIARRDARGWRKVAVSVPATLRAVHGAAADDVWMVGDSGQVTHSDGATLTHQKLGTSRWSGVWAAGPDDVWIVGDDLARHWDGQSWTQEPLVSGWKKKRAIHGTASNDIWAVGDSGAIAHYDGTTWAQMTSPTTSNLISVWARSPTEVWAVGGINVVLRYDGTQWSKVSAISIPQSLKYVVGDGAGAVYIFDGSNAYVWNGLSLVKHTYTTRGVYAAFGVDQRVFTATSFGDIFAR